MHDGSGGNHPRIGSETGEWNARRFNDRLVLSQKNNPKIFAEQLEQCEGLSAHHKQQLSEAFREGHKDGKGYDYANQLAFSWLRKAYDTEHERVLRADKKIAALKSGPQKRAVILAIAADSPFVLFRNALLTLNYPLIRLKTHQAVVRMAVRDETDQYYERFDDILQRVLEYFVSSGLLTYDPDQKFMFSTWLGDSVTLYTERALKEVIFGTGYVSAASNVRRARLKPGNEVEVERLQGMRSIQAAVANPFWHTHGGSEEDQNGIRLDNTLLWSSQKTPLAALMDASSDRLIGEAMAKIRFNYRPLVTSVLEEEKSYRAAATQAQKLLILR